MKLSAPKKIVFIIAAIIALVAVILEIGLVSISLPLLTPFWLMTVAFVLLALGNLLKGF